MIIDDEIYVVALIEKLIDWAAFDMAVVATANDGISAIQKAKEIQPDIIIVDVKMPGCNGIEFMDTVRTFNSSVHMIVISGHKHFDYAKGAMRNSAEDYLLKPINKEELEKVLSNIHQKLINHQTQDRKIQILTTELVNTNEKLRSSLISDLIHGDFHDDINLNQNYKVNFSEGMFTMITLCIDVTGGIKDQQNEHLALMQEYSNLLLSQLKQYCLDCLFMIDDNLSYFILNYPKLKRRDIDEALKKYMTESQNTLFKFSNLSLYLCVGESYPSTSYLPDCYKGVLTCLYARGAYTQPSIVYHNRLVFSDNRLNLLLLDQYKEAFDNALINLNDKAIKLIVKELFSKAAYGAHNDSLIYYNLFHSICEKALEYFINLGFIQNKKDYYISQYSSCFAKFSSTKDYGDLISDNIATIMNKGNHPTDPDFRTRGPVRVACQYIRLHYSADISLSDISSQVNLSPVYFSKLFKQETKMNFIDYLNQVRIARAKEMLVKTSEPINELAMDCGFPNPKYFSKLFKKTVGITPKDYRNRHLGKD